MKRYDMTLNYWIITLFKGKNERRFTGYRVIVCWPATPDLMSHRTSNIDNVFLHLHTANKNINLQYHTYLAIHFMLLVQ